MELGNQIKKFRKNLGLTQKDLAAKANISRSYLADVENNRYNPSLETLKAIAISLNISLGELISENSNLSQAVEDFYYTDDENKKRIEDIEKSRLSENINTKTTLAAHRTDGYDNELPPEAKKELNDYIDYLKVKYKKKDNK